MIYLASGNGKGKTTGAIGQTIRYLGQGKDVAFLQFIKSGKFPTGEDAFFKTISDRVLHIKGGKGFVGILGDTLPLEEHAKAAQKLLGQAREIVQEKKYSLIVLDELNVAISLKLLVVEDVMRFLDDVPEKIDVYITGRDASQELIDRADVVTMCEEVKHPFHTGVVSKKYQDY